MEQKMAPGAGLTTRQKQLLDFVVGEPYFIKTFYLSGGTALSYWYLHHRQSDDLDFFSTIPFDYERIIRWFRQNSENVGYREVRFDEDYGFLKVDLYYEKDVRLLLDFHHYTNTILESCNAWHGLSVDSLTDIQVNKLLTIATVPRTRDYVDYYFISKSRSTDFGSLLEKVKKKFNESIDPVQLAKNFLKASEYKDYPRMLVPFDEKEMYVFYEKLARSLRSKILK